MRTFMSSNLEKTVNGKHCWSAPHNSRKNSWNRRPVTCRSLRRFVQKLGRCSYFVFLEGDFSTLSLPLIHPFILSPRSPTYPGIPSAVTESVQKFTNDLVDLRFINFRDLTFFFYFRRRCLRSPPVARNVSVILEKTKFLKRFPKYNYSLYFRKLFLQIHVMCFMNLFFHIKIYRTSIL